MFARISRSNGSGFLVEIVMIVIGISIALWFEGWFADREDIETELKYLEGLRNDLQVDIEQLQNLVTMNQGKIERLGAIIPKLADLAQAPPEEQIAALFEPSSYQFFQPSDFTYRSIQESGDFRLLRDEETKKSILRLIRRYRHIDTLQQNYIQALDDEYIPLLMRSFDILGAQFVDPSVTQQVIFRNVFAYALQDTQGRVDAYVSARTEASALLTRIKGQLGED